MGSRSVHRWSGRGEHLMTTVAKAATATTWVRGNRGCLRRDDGVPRCAKVLVRHQHYPRNATVDVVGVAAVDDVVLTPSVKVYVLLWLRGLLLLLSHRHTADAFSHCWCSPGRCGSCCGRQPPCRWIAVITAVHWAVSCCAVWCRPCARPGVKGTRLRRWRLLRLPSSGGYLRCSWTPVV